MRKSSSISKTFLLLLLLHSTLVKSAVKLSISHILTKQNHFTLKLLCLPATPSYKSLHTTYSVYSNFEMAIYQNIVSLLCLVGSSCRTK